MQQPQIIPDWSDGGSASPFEIPGVGYSKRFSCSKGKLLLGGGALALLLLLCGAYYHTAGHKHHHGPPAPPFKNTTVTVESANTEDDCAVPDGQPPLCQNGGECVNLVDSFACNCVSGYSGPNCGSQDKSPCPEDNSCDRENARCTMQPAQAHAAIAPATTTPPSGDSTAAQSACACSGDEHDGRGGVCTTATDITSSAWCYTSPGACSDGSHMMGAQDWSYLACCGHENAASSCPPSPPPLVPARPPLPPPTMTPDGYRCICHYGYHLQTDGLTCAQVQLCTNTTCMNGGECIDRVGYTDCRCVMGYTGLKCEVPPVSAPLYDRATGNGKDCTTDADCPAVVVGGRNISLACYHDDDGALRGSSNAGDKFCVITNCAPATCPQNVPSGLLNHRGLPKMMDTCCLNILSCSSMAQSQLNSRVAHADVHSFCMDTKKGHGSLLTNFAAHCSCS